MIECMDYDSDRERMVLEMNSDYFRLISRKCTSDYSDDQLSFLSDCLTLVYSQFTVVGPGDISARMKISQKYI
jgi:hypothetical protein